MESAPVFFAHYDDFRKWLEHHARSSTELWVGYHKKTSGVPSIDWPESVDQALCFGWIDGIRKAVDADRYKIRFTPRKPGSHWSRINVDKVKKLMQSGLMTEAGLAAFNLRKPENTAKASFEQESVKLAPTFNKQLKANKKAHAFFKTLTPYVQRASIWYVMQAKQETTRHRRMDILIADAEQGLRLAHLRTGKTTTSI